MLLVPLLLIFGEVLSEEVPQAIVKQQEEEVLKQGEGHRDQRKRGSSIQDLFASRFPTPIEAKYLAESSETCSDAIQDAMAYWRTVNSIWLPIPGFCVREDTKYRCTEPGTTFLIHAEGCTNGKTRWTDCQTYGGNNETHVWELTSNDCWVATGRELYGNCLMGWTAFLIANGILTAVAPCGAPYDVPGGRRVDCGVAGGFKNTTYFSNGANRTIYRFPLGGEMLQYYQDRLDWHEWWTTDGYELYPSATATKSIPPSSIPPQSTPPPPPSPLPLISPGGTKAPAQTAWPTNTRAATRSPPPMMEEGTGGEEASQYQWAYILFPILVVGLLVAGLMVYLVVKRRDASKSVADKTLV
jgi:hypothetical protein